MKMTEEEKDKYGYPLEECDVIITLKDNQTFKGKQVFRGKYDPSIGFMTSYGGMIWKENILSYRIIKEQIVDFEKENVELKTEKIPRLERKIASIRGAHSVDCKKLKARTEQVERLKKENAELRKQVSSMSKALVLNLPEEDEKLDKAKEIIKELLATQSQLDPYRNIFKDRILKAEQFLEEVNK